MLKAAIMAGGTGTRLDTPREKPLVQVGGKTMLQRMLDTIDNSQKSSLEHLCLSPNAPDTLERYGDHPKALTTKGAGYHEDLAHLLKEADEPFLILPSDLPLLRPEHVDTTARIHQRLDRPISIVTTSHFSEKLGLQTRNRPTEYAGINVLQPNSSPQNETRIILDRPGTALNVNNERELKKARELASSPD